MRVKSLLLTIVLNIFLMLVSSVMLEYINLSERFQELENTFQVALDSAIGVAVGSEEMFSDDFQQSMSSFASSDSGTKNRVTYSTTLLYRSGKFYQVNSYALAKFYENNNRLPNNAGEISSLARIWGSSDQTTAVFEWLYGKSGSDYTVQSLDWANNNKVLIRQYDSSGVPRRQSDGGDNQDFINYYRSVGRYQQTAGYLKHRGFDLESYNLDIDTYPTLVNMGFGWMDNLNTCDSEYTADNFTSTVKLGKSYSSINKSTYYLTPMSLGVTYIPVEVLKPCMIANLDSLVRLNLLAGGTELSATSDVQETLNNADKCVGTSVYGSVMGDEASQHVRGRDENIITDGNIEYDLNTLKVKVDYFFVDFKDNTSSNKRLISRLEGCLSAAQVTGYSTGTVVDTGNSYSQDELRGITLSHFRDQDSAMLVNDVNLRNAYSGVKDGRIVARVSARIKIHVPYKSSIMQWMCERGGNPGHYGMKLWNPSTDRIDRDSDGVWYQYTTYYMQSRS